MLRDLSKTIAEYVDLPISESKPIVGDSAYKHKAGTHLAAILRNPQPTKSLNLGRLATGERLSLASLRARTVPPTFCPCLVLRPARRKQKL